MHRAPLAALAASLILALTACGVDAGGGDPDVVALNGAGAGGTPNAPPAAGETGPGSYALESVEGNSLPCGFKYAFIISGTLDVQSDGTFSMRFSWRGELEGSRYTGEDGTWSQSGEAMTFTPNSDPSFTAKPGAGGLDVTYDFDGDGVGEEFLFSR